MKHNHLEDLFMFLFCGIMCILAFLSTGIGFWFVYKVCKGIYHLLILLISKI